MNLESANRSTPPANRLSLQNKIILLNVGFALLVIASMTAFSVRSQSYQLRTQLEKHGKTISKLLAYNARYGVLTGDTENLNKLIGGVKDDLDVAYVVISDDKGKPIAQHNISLMDINSVKENLLTHSTNRIEYENHSGDQLLEVATPIIVEMTSNSSTSSNDFDDGLFSEEEELETPSEPIATVGMKNRIGVVQVGLSKRGLNETIRKARDITMLIGLSLVVVGAIAPLLMMRLVVRPIKMLNEVANRLANGDVNVSVEVDRGDELGSLAYAFNRMVMNIRKLLEEAENARLVATEQGEYLSHSVDQMLLVIDKFADGDLTIELQVDKNDEIGKLYNGFNRALVNLRALLQQVVKSVEAAASASTEISSSTEQIARGASLQAKQTGEVAAAVEEMSHTISENARGASKTASVASESGKVAGEGGAIVQQTIKKMKQIANATNQSVELVERLGTSSTKIGKIVSLINEIADQTNLLALNAAIEAARAGEQGRGFAVVADEVRKLAERTGQATEQITAMIEQIQEDTREAVNSMKQGNQEVIEGIGLSDKAGESLQNIVFNVETVVEMVDQIATASDEQTATSQEIARNVEATSSIAKEAADGISQIAHTADDLSRMTEHLQSLVLRFKLELGERPGLGTNQLAVQGGPSQ